MSTGTARGAARPLTGPTTAAALLGTARLLVNIPLAKQVKCHAGIKEHTYDVCRGVKVRLSIWSHKRHLVGNRSYASRLSHGEARVSGGQLSHSCQRSTLLLVYFVTSFAIQISAISTVRNKVAWREWSTEPMRTNVSRVPLRILLSKWGVSLSSPRLAVG